MTPDSGAPTGGLLSINPYSGSLTVSIAKTDFTDAISGIATNIVTRSNAQAPSSPGVCPLGGYSGATVVGASDTVPTDGQCYQYTLTGTDNVGNAATFQTIVLVDTTGPSGGSLSYVDGLASLSSVSIDWVGGSDPESGIASVQIERATATLSGSTCGGFGSFAALGGPVGSSPTVDSSIAAGNCYAYRLEVTNNTGVTSTFTSPSVARITNSSPITVAAGNPAGVYLGGTTVWVGPAAANLPWKLELTNLGQNGVTTATWDGKSAATFTSSPATPTVANSAPFHSGTYKWDGTGTLTDTIHVIRDPGGTDDFVDVRSDTDQPRRLGQLPERGDPDALRSRLDERRRTASPASPSVSVQRSETTLTGSTCGATWSAFAPVTLSGGNDTTVADSMCYRYQVVVTDNVGNSSTFGSASVVQIPDTTAPTFLSAATNVAGTQLTINMSEPLDGTATTQAECVHGRLRRRRAGIADRHRRRGLDGHARPRIAAEQLGGSSRCVTRSRPPTGERMRDNASPTKNETTNFGPRRGRQQHAGHSRAERRLHVGQRERADDPVHRESRRHCAGSDCLHRHHRQHDADRDERLDERQGRDADDRAHSDEQRLGRRRLLDAGAERSQRRFGKRSRTLHARCREPDADRRASERWWRRCRHLGRHPRSSRPRRTTARRCARLRRSR